MHTLGEDRFCNKYHVFGVIYTEEFETFLKEHLYGFDLDQYVFIPCCFRKRTNDLIAEYCSINGLSVKTSGWSLFRDKEYLAKYEYQDELEGILRSYIKRFEGGEVLCEDLRPFHSYNQEDNPIGVVDIRFKKRFDEKTPATTDFSYWGNHYATLEDYAIYLNDKFGMDLDVEKVAVCQENYSKEDLLKGKADVKELVRQLSDNGYMDTAKWLAEKVDA